MGYGRSSDFSILSCKTYTHWWSYFSVFFFFPSLPCQAINKRKEVDLVGQTLGAHERKEIGEGGVRKTQPRLQMYMKLNVGCCFYEYLRRCSMMLSELQLGFLSERLHCLASKFNVRILKKFMYLVSFWLCWVIVVLSCVWFFVTLWTVACQAPLSLGLYKQEYWSGLPFLSPGDLPNPGIRPRSPAMQVNSSPSEPAGKSLCCHVSFSLVAENRASL